MTMTGTFYFRPEGTMRHNQYSVRGFSFDSIEAVLEVFVQNDLADCEFDGELDDPLRTKVSCYSGGKPGFCWFPSRSSLEDTAER